MDRPRIVVDRPVWTVSDAYQLGSEDTLDSIPITSSRAQLVKKKIQKSTQKVCSPEGVLKIVVSIFPCIGWIKTYKLKEYIVCDIVSGITSAIFHVPQGMANALANSVQPVYGLYGSFFPSVVYSIMGTSMQCSVGTFTVISLMTANAVRRLATVEDNPASDVVPGGIVDLNVTISNFTDYVMEPPDDVITPIEVTVAVTFLAGVIQVILGLMRLGRLGVLISPSLASGFMTGCAVQIITSQLKGIFNLKFKSQSGCFGVPLTLYMVIVNFPNASLITGLLSLATAICLIVLKDYVNPVFQRIVKAPLPVDLLMVIICTVVSYCMQLKDVYGVPIVNNIPRGLPAPVAPRASLIKEVIGDAIGVALVSFAATYSMGKTFARKYNHRVDSNQELLALGGGNILGGFFLSLPAASSLARSAVLESVGCKTQLTGMISCVFLALVLYFVAPLLEPLPKCVLATILATALKNYLFSFVEVKSLWAISKADAIVWVMTCLSVIILDVTYGLIIGVIFTLLSVTWRMQSYRGTLLREVKASGIYLPKDKKKKVSLSPEVGNIIIFRFGNPICFATAGNFEADISRIIKQIQQTRRAMSTGSFDSTFSAVLQNGDVLRIVIDLSSTCFVDNSGVETLKEAINKCRNADIEIFLAAIPDNVVTTLEKSGTIDLLGLNNVFPTIQDAVIGAHSLAKSFEATNGDVHIIQVSDPSVERDEDLVQTTLSVRDPNGQILQAAIYRRKNGEIVHSSYL